MLSHCPASVPLLRIIRNFINYINDKNSKDWGLNIPGISRGDILKTEVRLHPLNEQSRIVQKVDELMALCDKLKERLNQASETRSQLADTVVEAALG